MCDDLCNNDYYVDMSADFSATNGTVVHKREHRLGSTSKLGAEPMLA